MARSNGTTYIRFPMGAYLTSANNGLNQPEITVADNLYSQTEYDKNYTNGYNAGKSAGQNATGTLVGSFTGNEFWNFKFSANQSMSKGLVTVVVPRDVPDPVIGSISCDVGSLTLIDSKDVRYSGEVHMQARQYVWSGNGKPTITVTGWAMVLDWCTIVKLA